MSELKLTADEHLHGKTPEQVFRLHHGLDVATGDPRPGVEEPTEGCECAHCAVYRGEADAEELNALKVKFQAAKEKRQQKKA